MAIDINDPLYQVPAPLAAEMYQPVIKTDISELTTGEVDGNGIFDKLMTSVNAHIRLEFEKNRITGAEYTKTYIQLTQAAMATALQFLLNREQTFWASQQAQIAAINARVRLETDRVGYSTANYNLATTLPAQTLLLEQQRLASVKQVELLTEQILLTEAQAEVSTKQAILVNEQTEVQRAQTMDTRLDGATAVAGTVAKQKALFTQQVTAYQRDSEVKAAKIFADSWTVQKTVDEGLEAPDGFTNPYIENVLETIMTNNGFPLPP